MQYQQRLPTVAEYVTAFRAVEPRITPKQREMLQLHHAAQARVVSATRLAEEVGYDGYGGANLQYGELAKEIASALAIDVKDGDVAVGILVDFVEPGYAGNQHFLWVMRPNVAQALEDLGWVPRVSHLLYPDAALKELSAATS